MVKVLLIEDDASIARIIKYYLAQEGEYDVRWADSAEKALDVSGAGQDIILLDVMLPKMNGFDCCAQLRRWYKCPILFISCLNDSETIIRALESGGDDYLTKPFDNKVLHAKIEATLRRVRMDSARSVEAGYHCRGFSFDPEQQTLLKNGQTIRLLAMESRLLAYLIAHQGQCFPASELYKAVWEGQAWGDSRTVAVHIYNLRKKLENDIKNPQYIQNLWGKGYCFCPEGY